MDLTHPNVFSSRKDQGLCPPSSLRQPDDDEHRDEEQEQQDARQDLEERAVPRLDGLELLDLPGRGEEISAPFDDEAEPLARPVILAVLDVLLGVLNQLAQLEALGVHLEEVADERHKGFKL